METVGGRSDWNVDRVGDMARRFEFAWFADVCWKERKRKASGQSLIIYQVPIEIARSKKHTNYYNLGLRLLCQLLNLFQSSSQVSHAAVPSVYFNGARSGEETYILKAPDLALRLLLLRLLRVCSPCA